MMQAKNIKQRWEISLKTIRIIPENSWLQFTNTSQNPKSLTKTIPPHSTLLSMIPDDTNPNPKGNPPKHESERGTHQILPEFGLKSDPIQSQHVQI